MRFKAILSFLIAGVAAASAQGFADGVQYYRIDQPEDAEIIINKVYNEPSTDKALANYYLGQIALDRGNIAEARDYFNKGIAANAENPYNYVGLGRADLKSGNKNDAEDQFKIAKKLVKKDDVLLVEIARAYYETDPVAYDKNIQDLLKDARKANKLSASAAIFEAERFGDQGNYNEAARYFDMAKANLQQSGKAAEYPEAFVNYARIIFKVNENTAIEQLQELLNIAPNSALAQRELAEKYYDSNKLKAAADEYGKYMNNPNHFQRDEQRYVSLLFFGEDYNKSNEWADKVLSKDPGNFYMKRMKMYNYAALNDSANTINAANDFFAIADGPFNAHDYVTYGQFLLDGGQDSLAVIQYEKAIQLDPKRNSLYSDLSAAYTGNKEYIKAAEMYQKFMDTGDHPVNDYMVLARRYQNATAQAEEGSPERKEYAAKAAEALDYVDSKAPENDQVYLSRAQLAILANDNQVNDEVKQRINELIALLDSKGTPENYISQYTFAYTMLGSDALNKKDYKTALEYFTKLHELDPSNTQIANAIETLQSAIK